MTSTTLWKVKTEENNWGIEQVILDDSIKSLDRVSTILPNGAYTTFRTYHHDQVLSLEKHFSRLEETTRLAGKPIKIYPASLRLALREISKQLSDGDIRFRITIDLEQKPGTMYVSTEPLKTPSQIAYELGGAALTYQLERNNPKAKMTGQLGTAAKIRQQFADEPVNEIITMSSNGIVLEGLSSNFFAVKDDVIWTADEEVLSGTVRNVVLELANKADYKVMLKGLPISELPDIDEAFVTSTSRSILPIVKIDHHHIGSGKPGPITRQLMHDFDEMLGRELKSI
jgi:branched-chain amino acid aminotransferase